MSLPHHHRIYTPLKDSLPITASWLKVVIERAVCKEDMLSMGRGEKSLHLVNTDSRLKNKTRNFNCTLVSFSLVNKIIHSPMPRLHSGTQVFVCAGGYCADHVAACLMLNMLRPIKALCFPRHTVWATDGTVGQWNSCCSYTPSVQLPALWMVLITALETTPLSLRGQNWSACVFAYWVGEWDLITSGHSRHVEVHLMRELTYSQLFTVINTRSQVDLILVWCTFVGLILQEENRN